MIEIFKSENNKIGVRSPYYPAFIESARALGGKWKEDAWYFDARDLERVQAALDEHYGEHGEEDVQRVTLRLDLNLYPIRGNVDYFAGKQTFYRYDRDSRVKLGEGVVLIAGAFHSSGGSRKNPIIGAALENSVAEIRDVPLKLAHRCCTVRGVSILEITYQNQAKEPIEAKYPELFGDESLSHYEGPAFVPENRPLTVKEAQAMFEAKDRAQLAREEREELQRKKAAERAKIFSLEGALNYCEFVSVQLELDELNTQVGSNLAAIEQEGASPEEVGAQIIEDASDIATLAQKLIGAVQANGGKVPSERCGSCCACMEEKDERENDERLN